MVESILWKNKNNIWEYDLDKLINLIEVISCNFRGKQELQNHLGVYREFLDRIELKHNIKIKYNFMLTKNDPRFKAIYQDYNWCYQKYIVEGFNHDEMAKEANCSKRVVEKWCCEKHKLTQEYRRKHKELTKTQGDLIIGSLLGDGHIDKRETQPIFIVSHAENQKDYLYWKYEIVKDLCNIPPSYSSEEMRKFDNGKEYLCQPTYRVSTRIYDCFYKYREMTKEELINQLNELSLSIFVLDDGFRSSSNWELCIANFSSENKELFINVMKDKFDLDAYVCKYDNRYMKFTANSSRKLDSIILKNIPNDLDIINYKIINNKISKEQKRIYINYKDENIYLKDFCEKNNLKYKYIHKIINQYKLANGEDVINFINERSS